MLGGSVRLLPPPQQYPQHGLFDLSSLNGSLTTTAYGETSDSRHDSMDDVRLSGLVHPHLNYLLMRRNESTTTDCDERSTYNAQEIEQQKKKKVGRVGNQPHLELSLDKTQAQLGGLSRPNKQIRSFPSSFPIPLHWVRSHACVRCRWWYGFRYGMVCGQ